MLKHRIAKLARTRSGESFVHFVPEGETPQRNKQPSLDSRQE